MPLSATHRPQNLPVGGGRVRSQRGGRTGLASGLRLSANGLLLRLSAALHSNALDRELADGVEPQTTPVLALRAQQLTGARSRTLVTDGLAGALASATDGTPGITAAIRPQAQELREACPVLAALERRLLDSAPVTAQGVALLRVLLTDAASPLYQPSGPGELASRLRVAAAALEHSDHGR